MPNSLHPLPAHASQPVTRYAEVTGGHDSCRYEREQGQGHRPLLKALLEQDHPANRPMVLCVSAIAYKGDGKVLHHQPGDQQQHAQQQEAVQSAGKQAQVQLTDGWYGVIAVLDQDLTRLVQAGNLKLGKLS